MEAENFAVKRQKEADEYIPPGDDHRLHELEQKRQIWTAIEKQRFFSKLVASEPYDNLNELFHNMERVYCSKI